jgi:hypothetical protein
VAEPVIKIAGEEVTVGRFSFVDEDIAAYLENQSKDHRTKTVRDAIIIGMKVMLDQQVSLSTDAVLQKVEERINHILTNPAFQDEGSPFAHLIAEFKELKVEIQDKKSKKKHASYNKGDTYEDYIENLLKEELGFSANIFRTGSAPTDKGKRSKPGDISLVLNSNTQYATHIAIEAKDRAKTGLTIKGLRNETERIISERKVPVVVWAISNELAQKLLQSGAIDWNIEYGYVIVNIDPEKPEQARPLLGAAIRVAQLVHEWQLKVGRPIDLQSAHELVVRLNMRLLKINEITSSLKTIESAQKDASDASTSLKNLLKKDIDDFVAELGPSSLAGQQ